MRAAVLAAVTALLLAASPPASPQPSYDPPAEQPHAEQLVERTWKDPVGAIEVAPDGTVYFADLDGPVWALDPGATEPRVAFDPPVVRGPEWGITDVILAPDHAESGALIVAYATADEGVDPESMDAKGEMRVVRVVDGNESLVYSYEATRFHNSGRLLVVDDHLFVSRGEQNQRSQAQDPQNPAGAILRMTLDGEPAPDNPFGGYVWAYGFRNPFGLAWDDSRGWLVEAEVGHNANEEINAVVAGANYGWPVCEGPCDPPRDDMEDPLVTYPEVITPTGMVVVGDDYFHGSFNRGLVFRVSEESGTWTSEVVYEHPELIVDLEKTPDSAWLYFGTYDGLWRIRTPGVDAAPDGSDGSDDGTDGSDDGTDGSDDGTDGSDDGTDGTDPVDDPPVDPPEARGPIPGPGVALAALCLAAVAALRRRDS